MDYTPPHTRRLIIRYTTFDCVAYPVANKWLSNLYQIEPATSVCVEA